MQISPKNGKLISFCLPLQRDLKSDNPQEGQVTLGLSNSECATNHKHDVTAPNTLCMYLKKWGKHYTRSLWCAHKLQQVELLISCFFLRKCLAVLMLQQCHNYKDPSVQLYGGTMFKVTGVLCFVPLCVDAPHDAGHRRCGGRSLLHFACTQLNCETIERGLSKPSPC
jgi:hypothetical protein